MADEKEPQAIEPQEGLQEIVLEEPLLEMRSESRRELDIRIVPWEKVIRGDHGLETFQRGAFANVDPTKVRLKGPDSRGKHEGPVVGKGIGLQERDDAAYMTFKVSKTAHGDELLTLVADGVVEGASMSFFEVPGGTSIQQRDGQRLRVQKRVGLDHVVTTWRPAYEQAAVVQMRSKDDVEAAPAAEPSEAEVAPMADSPAPENGATPQIEHTPDPNVGAVQAAVASMTELGGSLTALTGRLESLEERSRSNFTLPNPTPEKERPSRGHWMDAVINMMAGERIGMAQLQERALADIITTDNIGVVPDTYSQELIGVIDPRRPFMQSTRHLQTPDSGMNLIMPRIVTRPTVGIQANEKDQLTSTATEIDTATFEAVSKGGAGDISLQLLRRSSPSFLTLYMDLLAEAYAIDSEQEAVESLLASGVNSGGAMDPEDLTTGAAWSDTFDAVRRAPDTIWLSSAAVGKFIDAKSAGTNAPLYSNLNADFTAAGGVGGSIQGLRPVHVPALNATDIDVVIGPSTGFAWAEDGTFTLQVDVPAKAGRDVALIGILWFAPLYPSAFTAYSVAGGGS